MAKLYWRVKRDGKWTWKAAEAMFIKHHTGDVWEVYPLEEEE